MGIVLQGRNVEISKGDCLVPASPKRHDEMKEQTRRSVKAKQPCDNVVFMDRRSGRRKDELRKKR